MMNKVVVDTDIIIDFLRTGKGEWLVLAELAAAKEVEICVSSITVMELFAGKSLERQRELVLEIIERLEVVAFDEDLARLAGERKRNQKRQMALADFIIGMTALSVGAKLATKNKKHFEGISGLKFLSI